MPSLPVDVDIVTETNTTLTVYVAELDKREVH